MSEHVLGTGQKQTLRNILRLTEALVVRTEGPPREMRLWTEGIRLTARRPDYKGDYENFRLVFELKSLESPEAVEQIAEEYPDLCSVATEEDQLVFECPREGVSFSPKVFEPLNKLSLAVKLPEVWHVEGADFRVEPISVEMLFHAMV